MTRWISSFELTEKIRECQGREGRAVAFLPVGCTEQHGPFLPVQTDSLIAEAVAEDLSGRVEGPHWAQVFPAVGYAPTKSNADYPGTVSVDEEPFRHYLRDIGESLLRSDFDALVFVSGHGPADLSLKEIAFNLVHEQFAARAPAVKPVFVVSLSEFRPRLEKKFGQKPGRHADWVELLALVHLLGSDYFDSKRIAAIQDFQKRHSFEIEAAPVLGIPLQYRSVQGVVGDPAPLASENWKDLAQDAWEETLRFLAEDLKEKMKKFWSGEFRAC